ncbi:MAG: hypothetical protein B6229_02695 [Spirochaetaceae bacterium 4572_7]|nr:MAG: hypothetical protein B6229_02695 [Spirochaetaceae bacterium 4572_7]
MDKKVGLVLEGGGAKGSYHLGVYKALHEMGYQFSGIAGTSIGALNGAIIAQGDWEKAYSIWDNISNEKIYGIDESTLKNIMKGNISLDNVSYVTNLLREFIKKKGIDTANMKSLFFSILNEDKLQNSKVDLGIVTVKVEGFKTVEIFKENIEPGQMQAYLMASANFPLFQREETKDGQFIDGGIKNNLPLNMLPQKGINELIAIRTFGVGVTKSYSNSDVHVTYIEPSKNLGGTLDFNNKTAKENLLLGYFDAYRTIQGYVGREFCIKPLMDDFLYINQMFENSDERILKAAKVMGYNNVDSRRFMFERLLPQIAEYLNLGLETSYETLLLLFFEEIAMILPMDKTVIYDADEFISEVKRKFVLKNLSLDKYLELPKIVKSSQFLTSFVKNDFFQFIMDIFFK